MEADVIINHAVNFHIPYFDFAFIGLDLQVVRISNYN